MVIVFVESLVKEPLVPIISSEPFSIVSVPVVSVNGVSSVTITFPSMIISSEPVGRASLLQFDASDQTPVAPPSQTPLGQTLSGWFPVIETVVTPVQSLFIVPILLSMVPPPVMVC